MPPDDIMNKVHSDSRGDQKEEKKALSDLPRCITSRRVPIDRNDTRVPSKAITEVKLEQQYGITRRSWEKIEQFSLSGKSA